MTAAAELAQIAALIGDPARANMLCRLLDGEPHDATDLALSAGVSPQTASWHLANLIDGRLLVADKQGRRRLFRLASPAVAQALEAVLAVDGGTRRRPKAPSKADEALRTARTCYDHLAGKLGVALADALVARRRVILTPDGGEVTVKGARFFADFGIDFEALARRRRVFCRPCVDWTERRPHIAGALGAALAERAFALGWIERVGDSRALAISPRGREGFAEVFGVALQP